MGLLKRLFGGKTKPPSPLGQEAPPERVEGTTPPGVPVDTAAVIDSQVGFAFDLYAALRAKQANLFFSPFSVATALTMTWAGARGQTASQMARVLRLTLESDRIHQAMATILTDLKRGSQTGENQIHLANGLFPQRNHAFLDEFTALLISHYDASTTPVDYKAKGESARRLINTWVAKNTREIIPELILPGLLGPSTRLVLVNAIYFKGIWAYEFESSQTKEDDFWLASPSSIRVSMMTQTQRFPYWANKSLQILELSYRENRFSMLLLLPRKREGLADLEKSLSWPQLKEWTARLEPERVALFLPKFRLNESYRLEEALGSLGMKHAFSEKKADFSGMDQSQDGLFIDAVIHQASLKVDEQGTEAAAATAMALRAHLPEKATVFRANHPFAVLIRDRTTGNILFMGRVGQPQPA